MTYTNNENNHCLHVQCLVESHCRGPRRNITNYMQGYETYEGPLDKGKALVKTSMHWSFSWSRTSGFLSLFFLPLFLYLSSSFLCFSSSFSFLSLSLCLSSTFTRQWQPQPQQSFLPSSLTYSSAVHLPGETQYLIAKSISTNTKKLRECIWLLVYQVDLLNT